MNDVLNLVQCECEISRWGNRLGWEGESSTLTVYHTPQVLKLVREADLQLLLPEAPVELEHLHLVGSEKGRWVRGFTSATGDPFPTGLDTLPQASRGLRWHREFKEGVSE